MQAIELNATITRDHEIHLKLPPGVNASEAKVIILYENKATDEATARASKWERFFATASIFGDDFLAERDNTMPQEREFF